MCPYLANVKKLDYEQSFEILKTWLEKCDDLRELDFNPDREIRTKIRYVKDYNPISIKTLMKDNKNFYRMLKRSYNLL